MLLKKQGFPEPEELVISTVTGINPHSVFVTLDEYGGRTGMIHISEIAPGRIRNIREYVEEGKKIVCKVLQINKEKGHIDLSLRRVNESQKRNKLNEIKQEQLAEKIIENVARQNKQKPDEFYKKITTGILQHYATVYEAFEAAANGQFDLTKITDNKTAQQLLEVIQQRIKPPEVTISGELTLTSYAPNGVQLIKETLKIAVDAGLTVRYLGAGTYHIEITDKDYKVAEKKLKTPIEELQEYAEKHKLICQFARKEET